MVLKDAVKPLCKARSEKMYKVSEKPNSLQGGEGIVAKGLVGLI